MYTLLMICQSCWHYGNYNYSVFVRGIFLPYWQKYSSHKNMGCLRASLKQQSKSFNLTGILKFQHELSSSSGVIPRPHKTGLSEWGYGPNPGEGEFKNGQRTCDFTGVVGVRGWRESLNVRWSVCSSAIYDIKKV